MNLDFLSRLLSSRRFIRLVAVSSFAFGFSMNTWDNNGSPASIVRGMLSVRQSSRSSVQNQQVAALATLGVNQRPAR